jgi:deoxyribodipyrimidine photo-lyase
MPITTPTVIHWFRRDLRITDNTSLLAAAATGLPVLPVYSLTSWSENHNWTGAKRQQFLCGCLQSLDANLQTIGGRLIVRQGSALDSLQRLAKETNAVAIHFNRDPDPFGKETEKKLEAWCRSVGIECHGHDDTALHTPAEVLTQSETPYRVYTPFSRRWLALEKRKPSGKPRDLRTPPQTISLPLPTLAHWKLAPSRAILPEPGERAAMLRFREALDQRIARYAARRDIPSSQGTSRISQDLRFGLISIRKIHEEILRIRSGCDAAGKVGCDTYLKELAWREFYFAILHFFPNVLHEEFNPDWRGLAWHKPGKTWEAWTQGRTGFPIVDAGIRELLATGFMHNRVRMITAMFLTKDLHIDWRHGESFFMQHLLDGEIASNNGGWQWSAGTGADAAPYFRIQNPWTQSARYDPDGTYIKQWVPELAQVDPKLLAQAPADNKPIAPDYPLPCVDHATERDRTLSYFKRHREKIR